MERLDQSHLHPLLEHPGLTSPSPGIELEPLQCAWFELQFHDILFAVRKFSFLKKFSTAPVEFWREEQNLLVMQIEGKEAKLNSDNIC